jgi:hypothetical protein
LLGAQALARARGEHPNIFLLYICLV